MFEKFLRGMEIFLNLRQFHFVIDFIDEHFSTMILTRKWVSFPLPLEEKLKKSHRRCREMLFPIKRRHASLLNIT